MAIEDSFAASFLGPTKGSLYCTAAAKIEENSEMNTHYTLLLTHEQSMLSCARAEGKGMINLQVNFPRKLGKYVVALNKISDGNIITLKSVVYKCNPRLEINATVQSIR
jgi:hypothetical protein